MKWEEVKLGEVCVSIYDGTHQAPPKSEDGVPFITISNIDKSNKIDFTDTAFVSKEYYDGIDEKRKARKGDILYTVVGSFGIPVYIKKDIEFVFQRHIAILRPSDEIDGKFLYYTMLSRDFYMQADSVALGAAQRTITLNSLRNMTVKLPNLEAQKSIASILSAYDDLIENNQKQIKLLEEAAQRLYKEWFVDLRFPGHEDVEIVDGLPEGWSRAKLSELGTVITGKTPSTSNEVFYGNDVPFVKIPDMHNKIFPLNVETYLSEEGANSQKGKYLPPNALLISCIGTAGLINITVEKCQTNQQINALVLINGKILYYIYYYLKGVQELLQGLGSNGATMTNVNKKKLESILIEIPRYDLLENFFDYCKPVFDKILMLSKENISLQEARDRLLHRLMSGEVEV